MTCKYVIERKQSLRTAYHDHQELGNIGNMHGRVNSTTSWFGQQVILRFKRSIDSKIFAMVFRAASVELKVRMIDCMRGYDQDVGLEVEAKCCQHIGATRSPSGLFPPPVSVPEHTDRPCMASGI